MTKVKVTIQAQIAATPDKVWDYWTNPKHIVNWNFASDDWCCPKAENDLRIGGKYSARMEAKDKSFGFDFDCIYTEVENLKTLNYTMGDGRTARTTFEQTANGTNVKTIFDAEGENSVEMQKNGWQAILDNFKKYTESH